MVNTKVLDGLNAAERVTDIYAYLLIEGSNTPAYTFLYNPEEKSFSRQAQYDAAVTALTSTPGQRYKSTSGLTLQLSNLLLESSTRGKTVKLLLERLQELMVADPTNGRYAPQPVRFVWGSDSFGPAVITELSWQETSWLNGEVATARVNLSLLEVPSEAVNPVKSKEERLRGAIAKSKTNKLTARQKQDAIAKARAWVKANPRSLSESLLARVKALKYDLSADDDGTVKMLSDKKAVLGIVGIYKDGKLNTSKNTLRSAK